MRLAFTAARVGARAFLKASPSRAFVSAVVATNSTLSAPAAPPPVVASSDIRGFAAVGVVVAASAAVSATTAECSGGGGPSAWAKPYANAWTSFPSKPATEEAFVTLNNRVALVLGVSTVDSADQDEGHPTPEAAMQAARDTRGVNLAGGLLRTSTRPTLCL